LKLVPKIAHLPEKILNLECAYVYVCVHLILALNFLEKNIVTIVWGFDGSFHWPSQV